MCAAETVQLEKRELKPWKTVVLMVWFVAGTGFSDFISRLKPVCVFAKPINLVWLKAKNWTDKFKGWPKWKRAGVVIPFYAGRI